MTAPARVTARADAARFARTRAAHRDETGEDYVEAIAQLAAAPRPRGADPGARVKDLAAMMGVSHVTVVRIVSRLRRLGLVDTARGRPVTLTREGERLAARARERHEVVLGFLRAIGVPPRQAAIDAEGIEHHVSDATLRAMRTAAARLAPARAGPAR